MERNQVKLRKLKESKKKINDKSLTEGQNSTKKVLCSRKNVVGRSTPVKERSSGRKQPGFSDLVKRHRQRREAQEHLDKQCSGNENVDGCV